jgi:hypothetical protein
MKDTQGVVIRNQRYGRIKWTLYPFKTLTENKIIVKMDYTNRTETLENLLYMTLIIEDTPLL